MKLIIVRHGETFVNLKDVFQDHFNSQLTLKDIQQYKFVTKRLKKEKIVLQQVPKIETLKKTFHNL